MTMRFPNAVTETNIEFSVPMNKVCDVIPEVILASRWRLEDENKKDGRFRPETGMTLRTWRQILSIAVSQTGEICSEVNIRREVGFSRFRSWVLNIALTGLNLFCHER